MQRKLLARAISFGIIQQGVNQILAGEASPVKTEESSMNENGNLVASEKFKLQTWIAAHRDAAMIEKDSTLAERATEALGFKIEYNHVAAARLVVGIKKRVSPRSNDAVNNLRDILTIAKAVRDLYEKLNEPVPAGLRALLLVD